MKNGLRFFLSPWKRIERLVLLISIFAVSGHLSMAMGAFDERRPNEHFCPITLQVMKEPVVAADGHSYEKSAILKHLETSSISPTTGLPLKNQDIFDNQALKAMISEWRLGKQSEPSALEGRSAEEIARRVKEEFRQNAGVFNSAKGQNIVVFLGNTGAGKSTLVNFLAGKELIVGPYADDFVLDNPDDKTAMAIGTGGNSETLYPKYIDVDGLRFFDLPGFNDTDGSERNLVNAAFIRQILLDAASVRLVFVAGQDQFTADRSVSVKQMFNCIKQLFVVGQDISLVDDAIFVATKVTWNSQGKLADFLVHRTNDKDRGELSRQLESWDSRKKLCCMFHPVRKDRNEGVREQILELIKGIRPAKILGINVSVMYPPDTKEPLERMFSRVIADALQQKFNIPLFTLSDYDAAINRYTSPDFWQSFDAVVCQEDVAIGLLKEFCVNQYSKAFKNIQKESEGKRQAYIQSLRDRKKAKIADIEKRTEVRVRDVISSLVPKDDSDNLLTFDFAYHQDFYDRVCSAGSIIGLATDPPEQEVVRKYYASFITRHSHNQMMQWYQRFGGMQILAQQIEDLQQKLSMLSVKASMAVPEAKPMAKVQQPASPQPKTLPNVASPPPDKESQPVEVQSQQAAVIVHTKAEK